MIDEKKINIEAKRYADAIYRSFENKILRRFVFRTFVYAINWFKENLWHDASEEPNSGLLLVEFDGDMNPLYNLHSSNEYTKLIHVSRWLYIEDLMKGGK